ncbi:MAG: DUF1501 domain-containing protein [Bacteroidetes bacterium]|nr:DUF1501 domain-containing protein [Bacteroidota bacterium]
MDSKCSISRRDFLRLTSFASVPLLLGRFPLSIHGAPRISASMTESDRVLVLVQLQGGNDGLNTLIDLNQYSALQAVRGNLLIPEQRVLDLEHDGFGFHPSMTEMKEMWERGTLGMIQNVGYPDQNRSHFRSTDIWNSGSAADEYLRTGWMGRYYDRDFAGYPAGYPTPGQPHPFALTMGKSVSETCQGATANYSLALEDPFNPGMALVGAQGDIPADCYGDVLTFVNDTVRQTNAYAEAIRQAAEAGNNLSTKYREAGDTALATALKHVARLISGGLQTRLYIVQHGGFDTHDNQVVAGATDTGKHAELLLELSDAIAAFQDDVELLGLSGRVLGLTYSEFGRRIRSNAGLGTDHGTAAPHFLFGSCAKKQILGDAPEVDAQAGIEDGVPMQYDFRNMFGTLLHQWLGASAGEVSSLLLSSYAPLPIIRESCVSAADVRQQREVAVGEFHLYPNPARDYVSVNVTGSGEQITLRLFDGLGSIVREVASHRFAPGQHSLKLPLLGLPVGTYYLHYESMGRTRSRRFTKIR